MSKKARSVGSIKLELVAKSREAALAAIRTYNDPQVTFKSETFIVLMIIAWTYLLHAHYRGKGIEYRYFKQGPKRKVFDKTKRGSYKYWELKKCLSASECPVDQDTSNNLCFLIGLRHEIEHEMTSGLDDYLSGRYHACALNYNKYVKELFDDRFGLDELLSYTIQFAQLDPDQLQTANASMSIPRKVKTYVDGFDGALTHDEFNSPSFAYRLLFKRKLVNRAGQADRVIEFIDPNSDGAKSIDNEYWVKKEVERPKYRAKEIAEKVHDAGYGDFSVHRDHTPMWQSADAKNPALGFGVEVQGVWYWYDSWVEKVLKEVRDSGVKYRAVDESA